MKSVEERITACSNVALLRKLAMRSRPLLAFFLLTFGITWGIGACYALFPSRFTAWFGPISNANPLFYVAVYAPSLSALIVTAYVDGLPGLQGLLSRLFRWRVGIRWYLIVFFGMPALLVTSGVISAWLSGQPFDFAKGHKPLALFPILLSLVLDPGPLGEEPGWRGFALPRLLQRWGALSASIVLGLIWALWHLPAFLFSELPQSQFSIPLFFVACVALSVLMTWVYQHTQASILFAVLIHWLFNLDYLPRGRFDVMAAVLTLAALAVVVVNGPTRPSRSHSTAN